MKDLQTQSTLKKITFKDGSIYEGAFNLKNCIEGEGYLKLASGEEFTGTFEENKPSHGKYTTPKF